MQTSKQNQLSHFSEFKKYISGLLKKELSPNLFYHGWHHTMDVYANGIEIAKASKVAAKDLQLLKVAILLHDAGFVKTYDGHEAEGCKMAKKILPNYGFAKDDIAIVCGMITATKIPQSPQNLLEQIVADADLMYLGTKDFTTIGWGLFNERNIYFDPMNKEEWYQFQINFLKSHHFHTEYCIKKYEPKKQKNLVALTKKIKS